MTVERAHLTSSMCRQAEYDDEKQELTIWFNSGMPYTYGGVPKRVFEGLRDAPSAGQYFHQNIKNVYA